MNKTLEKLIKANFDNYFEFGKALWPDKSNTNESDKANIYNQVNNLVNGKRKLLSPDEIRRMMNIFAVGFDDLFPTSEKQITNQKGEKWEFEHTSIWSGDNLIARLEEFDKSKVNLIVKAPEMKHQLIRARNYLATLGVSVSEIDNLLNELKQ